jgi:hypothetical protein
MEQMTLFMVLGGLLILTLALASIAQRYHTYVEERRRQIERILRRVAELREIVSRLQGLAVPPEVLSLLHSDILARLEVVKQVHRRQPGIDAMLVQARSEQAASEQARVTPSALSEADFENLMRGLGQVKWMLQEGRFVVPLSGEESRRILQGIVQCRAESSYRFHRRECERRVQAGQLHQALWHGDQVRRFLSDEGPDSEAAREWYREMDQRCREISAEISGQSPEPSGEAPPSL